MKEYFPPTVNNTVSSLRKTGTASLPLHYGKAPSWLVTRMQSLAKEIITIIVDEYGQAELLQRLADPFWFQSLGCVLGYDWHSSGVTTVVTGVLKSVITPNEHGLAVAGGKGKASINTQKEIMDICKKFDFDEAAARSLQYSSRMSAKVDSAAIQSGYPLYHHVFFVNANGQWSVIQQGMNIDNRTARRYHWLSDQVENFVSENNEAIICDTIKNNVLDMTANESEESRKASVDLVNDGIQQIKRTALSINPSHQSSLEEWTQEDCSKGKYNVEFLYMPWNINWKALEKVYEFQPKNYEELLSMKGVGPSTIRGLALISEIIYGSSPSWKDPVKYSFAYGGKDGVPYPVDRRSMDKSTQFLREAVEKAKIGDKQKLSALNRLRKMIPEDN
jgi:uncharacterized protein